jgi:hypothetical protein
MSTEHLILGSTRDFITGEIIADTHDERARQKIARLLVNDKGFSKDDVGVRRKIPLKVDGVAATVTVDFVLQVREVFFALIIFGPGSLVSRERPALAAARLLESYVIPYAVVTNGQDAAIMQTATGTVVAEGLAGIPSKDHAAAWMQGLDLQRLSESRLEKERRILFAFDVLAEKECDEYTCRL